MTSKNKKTIDKKPIEDLSLLLDELNLTEIGKSIPTFNLLPSLIHINNRDLFCILPPHSSVL